MVDFKYIGTIINPLEFIYPLTFRKIAYWVYYFSIVLAIFYINDLVTIFVSIEKFFKVEDVWVLVVLFGSETAMLLFLLVFSSYPEVKSKDVEKSIQNRGQTALLITCHNSEDAIKQTLEAALLHFDPQDIYILDNANFLEPTDATKKVAAAVDPRINYIWSQIGNKTYAHYVGALAAHHEYIVAIDDDVLLPSNFFTPVDKITDEIKAFAYPLRAIDQLGNVPLFVAWQDIEYKLSDMNRLAQQSACGVLAPHGAGSFWDRKTFIETIKLHDMVFYGDDVKLGLNLMRLGKRMGIEASVILDTVVPTTVLGPPLNYYHQRVRSWEMGRHVLTPKFLWNLFFIWKLSNPFRLLAQKWFLLYELYTITLDWVKIICFILLRNSARFWILVGIFNLINVIPVLLWRQLKIRNRPDLKPSLLGAITFPLYKVLYQIVSVLGAFRCIFIYWPNFKAPYNIQKMEREQPERCVWLEKGFFTRVEPIELNLIERTKSIKHFNAYINDQISAISKSRLKHIGIVMNSNNSISVSRKSVVCRAKSKFGQSFVVKVFLSMVLDDGALKALREGKRIRPPLSFVTEPPQKELSNLHRLAANRIPCPRPLLAAGNILVTQAIEDRNGERGYSLDVAQIKSTAEYFAIYIQMVKILWKMYHYCQLVHNDFSVENLLYCKRTVYVMDVALLVSIDSTRALKFLMEGCKNVTAFITARATVRMKAQDLMDFILTNADELKRRKGLPRSMSDDDMFDAYLNGNFNTLLRRERAVAKRNSTFKSKTTPIETTKAPDTLNRMQSKSKKPSVALKKSRWTIWKVAKWFILILYILLVLVGIPLWDGAALTVYKIVFPPPRKLATNRESGCSCGYKDVNTGAVWMEHLDLTPKNMQSDFFMQPTDTDYYVFDKRNVKASDTKVDLIVHPPSDDVERPKVGGLMSDRADIKYGSFRTKVTFPIGVGTCAAFFLYENDLSESDYEYIGEKGTLFAGNQAADPSTQLSTDVWHHENFTSKGDVLDLGIEWVPEKVTWTLNGGIYHETPKYVPSGNVRIFISHWTAKNWDWVGTDKIKMTETLTYSVYSFKGLFNSSNIDRINEFNQNCRNIAPCEVNMN